MNNREFENNNMAESSEDSFVLEGRNAVLEALRSGKTIDKLYILDGCRDGVVNSIVREAKKQDTVINYISKEKLNQMSQAGKHQGVIAHAAAYKYAEIEDMFALAESRGEDPFFFILDEIEDPHNLGALIRCAEGAGAHGLIIPKRRSAGLTSVVQKASAGALEHLAIAKVANIASALDELKERNVWVYGAEADGAPVYDTKFDSATAIVVGSEGFGISRLVREKCDFIVSIPMYGRVNSFNVSCAAAVILCEAARQLKTK